MIWSLIEEAGKILLVKDGRVQKASQLWDRNLARKNPLLLTPAMFETAMSGVKRKLSDLGDGPSELEIAALIKQLRACINNA